MQCLTCIRAYSKPLPIDVKGHFDLDRRSNYDVYACKVAPHRLGPVKIRLFSNLLLVCTVD